MAGGLVIKLGFVAALCAAASYFRVHLRSSERWTRIARVSYLTVVAAQLTASALLLFAILTHEFQYTYVWSYSSTDLPLPLLLSTFYAGQEGSFMLWTLFTSLIGLFLLRYSSRNGYEPEVMSVYSLIISFLFVMLVAKNPFTYLWETFPSDLIQHGPVPAGLGHVVILDAAQKIWAQIPIQGRGLNPLLQNYWMVIHPQILFMGFSSMAVPYTLAVAGLLKRDYHSWIRVGTPWSICGAMILGVGIILGGYWAYETLGWGGFWGWDPVENSSLIPWLICVASIHTSLTQRKSGAFVRTNFVLSLLTFVMVLYSTFLTRSGILGETSVHSFVDAGMWVYWLLLAFISIFALLGFGLLLFRMREMPKVPVQHSVMSREFALFLGASALVFCAIFVVIGTSAPIITSVAKGKASAMDISYYVKTNLPLGIVITFLSGLGQLLWWRNSRLRSLLNRMVIPAIGGTAAVLLVVLMGREEFLILLFVFTSGFSLVANLQIAYDIYRGNPQFAGGSLAHIGIAIMCLGFVTSARYDQKSTVPLPKGLQVETLGYRLTYTGYRQVDAERYAFEVAVEKDGRTRVVAPVLHYSGFTQSVIRHPDLINYLNRDFYVAPVSVEEASSGGAQRTLTLDRSSNEEIAGMHVRFLGFDFTDAQRESMMDGKPFTIKAGLEVTEGSKRTRLTMVMKGGRGGGPEFVPAEYASDAGPVLLTISRMIPNDEDREKSKVEVAVQLPSDGSAGRRPETLIVEATIKPFINLVWVGTVTLAVGFALTMYRRLGDARQKGMEGRSFPSIQSTSQPVIKSPSVIGSSAGSGVG